jgi:hypothetical protein
VIQDSDEDPEITSGLKKGGFNVTDCSNRYFNFHFDKSPLCRRRRYIRNVLDMDCQTQGRLKLMIELYISEICHKFQ